MTDTKHQKLTLVGTITSNLNNLNKEAYINNLWKTIHSEISMILLQDKKTKSFFELHKSINIVLNFKTLDSIFSDLNILIQQYAQSKLPELHRLIQNFSSNIEAAFKDFSNYYISFNQKINYIRKLFALFENKYFPYNYSNNSTSNNLWIIFINLITKSLSNDEISFLSSTICSIFNEARNKIMSASSVEVIYNSLITSNYMSVLIKFMEESKIYDQILRNDFTVSTLKYYETLSQKLTNNFNVETFLSCLDIIYESEKKLSMSFVDESLVEDLYHIINDIVIDKNKKVLLETTFPTVNNTSSSILETSKLLKHLDASNPLIQISNKSNNCNNSSNMKNNNLTLDHLYELNTSKSVIRSNNAITFFFTNTQETVFKKVYSYLKQIEEINLLKTHWVNFIKANYTIISSSFEYYIFYLSLFKEFTERIITKCFDNDDILKNITKETLHKLINNKPTATAEMYAVYLNTIMTYKKENNAILTELVERFISLFKFLESKDTFLKFFCKQLHIRILYNTTIDLNFEKLIVDKFKVECGSPFSSIPENMLNDISLHNKLTKEYLAYSNDDSVNSLISKTEFFVLNADEWSFLHSQINFSLYEENFIDKVMIGFSDYYKSILQGRKLYWKKEQSNGVVKFNIKSKFPLYISIDYFQLNVISLLNSKESFDSKDLKEIKGVEDFDLIKVADKLVAKELLIKKEGRYYANNDIKIDSSLYSETEPLILHDIYDTKITASEVIEIEEKTIEDRKPVVDCLIMKTLKANKVISREKLIVQVKNSIRVPCNEQLILDRIENLLSNDYIYKSGDKDLSYVDQVKDNKI